MLDDQRGVKVTRVARGGRALYPSETSDSGNREKLGFSSVFPKLWVLDTAFRLRNASAQQRLALRRRAPMPACPRFVHVSCYIAGAKDCAQDPRA